MSNLPWSSCCRRSLIWCRPFSFRLLLRLTLIVFIDSFKMLITSTVLRLILISDILHITYLLALVFNSRLKGLSFVVQLFFPFISWSSVAAVAAATTRNSLVIATRSSPFTVLKLKMKATADANCWLPFVEFWINFETGQTKRGAVFAQKWLWLIFWVIMWLLWLSVYGGKNPVDRFACPAPTEFWSHLCQFRRMWTFFAIQRIIALWVCLPCFPHCLSNATAIVDSFFTAFWAITILAISYVLPWAIEIDQTRSFYYLVDSWKTSGNYAIHVGHVLLSLFCIP